jgi:hypothetical protein
MRKIAEALRYHLCYYCQPDRYFHNKLRFSSIFTDYVVSVGTWDSVVVKALSY